MFGHFGRAQGVMSSCHGARNAFRCDGLGGRGREGPGLVPELLQTGPAISVGFPIKRKGREGFFSHRIQQNLPKHSRISSHP